MKSIFFIFLILFLILTLIILNDGKPAQTQRCNSKTLSVCRRLQFCRVVNNRCVGKRNIRRTKIQSRNRRKKNSRKNDDDAKKDSEEGEDGN